MCLAIPVRITTIDGIQADVEIGGVARTIGLMLTPEAQVGDYVYVHAGYAISVVDEEEALESLRLLRELAETYPDEELFYTTGDTHRTSNNPAEL
ncbi:MAG: HypC/HybG/HupF family hydrogenase formation chaperone [Anaerolineae bacterium]|nr:HypC/HybG/HupF family hydrogenase formation chaperone [Anaerolineae bacterium]